MNNSHPVAQKIDSLIRVFLYILIFWLPYGPAVIESCVIVSLLLWIIKRTVLFLHSRPKKFSFQEGLSVFFKAFSPQPSFLNRPIAVFLFVGFLSAVGGAFPEESIHGFITKTLEWFIIYFLMLEVFCTPRQIFIFLSVLFVTAISTALDSFVQYYWTQKDIFFGHIIEKGGRVTAGFSHPNHLGGYWAFLVPLSCALAFYHKRKSFRLFFVFVFIVIIWSLFLTFSRAAWVGVFWGLLVFFLCANKKTALMALSAIGLGAVVFVLLLPPGSKQETRLKPANIISSGWGRQGLWVDSVGMIADRPLFGHGPNMYMRVFQEYRRKSSNAAEFNPTYAHNCFIQVAAETGLLGLLAFLWILAVLFKNVIEEIPDEARMGGLRILLLGLLCGAFSFLIHSFFDTNFYNLQLSAYFWVMAGLMVAIYKLLKTQDIHVIKVAR